MRVNEHPLYKRWAWMRQVCGNPTNPDYPRFGGRGIGIDPRFSEFWDFVDLIETHLGTVPNGYQSKLSRKDQSQDFVLSNLQWAEAKTVGRLMPHAYRIKYKNQTRTLKEWSEITGIPLTTLRCRYYMNWKPAQILGYKLGPKAEKLAKKRMSNERISHVV